MCPTPSDAFHYAYFMDEPVPDSVLMWKVQNKGYQTHEGFRVGMVARPWGFEDSPDAEYISSGVCAKTLDAVAIGRHGNFLHWGFAASPADMTEEAKDGICQRDCLHFPFCRTETLRPEIQRSHCYPRICERAALLVNPGSLAREGEKR